MGNPTQTGFSISKVLACLTFLSLGTDTTELTLPSIATPCEIVALVNSFILQQHCECWSILAGRPMIPPEITPDFCSSPQCPNSAIVDRYCLDCCRKRSQVTVRQSTIKGAGLRLFATKEFKSGDYICDYCYDMRKGRKGKL